MHDFEIAAKLDKLHDDLADAWECYGDIKAEYDSERYAFGDAWPGAAIQVRGARDTVTEIEDEIKDVLAEYGTKTCLTAKEAGWCVDRNVIDDDIPF